MAYQALYRKWRPAHFRDMVGQESTVRTLRNQVRSGHVAHAYLFCGVRGTGKTTSAQIFSLAINCLSPVEGDACGECANCVALSDPANMDIVEIDAASNNGVDEMRDLREKVKFPPAVGKYRVYIIDEVHMLSTGAFNALLKTLEEPPSHLVFILATTEAHKLPATILSRCQRFDFGRISLADIVGRLREVIEEAHREASEEALLAIARAAQGGMRDALSILDVVMGYSAEGDIELSHVRDALGMADNTQLQAYVSAMLHLDAVAAMTALTNMLRRGAQAQALLKDILEQLRALVITASCGEAAPALLEISQDEWAEYRAMAEGLGEPVILRVYDIFLPLSSEMRSASRPSYALEAATLRACFPQREESLDAVLSRLDALENEPRVVQAIASPAAANAPTAPPIQGAEKPVPVAKTPPAADAPPKEFDEKAIWKAAASSMKKNAISLYSVFSKGFLQEMTPDMVTIGFEPLHAINKTILEQPEKNQALEAAFSEAAGRPMKIRLLVRSQEPVPVEAAPKTGNIDDILTFFGRENVEIRDEN